MPKRPTLWVRWVTDGEVPTAHPAYRGAATKARDGVGSRGVQVNVLRELFRNLQAFRAFYEAEGQDTITGPDGREYCLFDIEHLYAQVRVLSPRQRQAIELCLVGNVKEKEASRIMGVSETNPVMMYATNGLRRICEMIDKREIPRYVESDEMAVA